MISGGAPQKRVVWAGVLMLLLFWSIRIYALDAFPLHSDEGLHLSRAVEVWNGHPFWNISDGKIINHWPVAALYPPGGGGPAFVARYATVLIAMTGLAAGVSLAYRLSGFYAALFAWVMWLYSPYLFFFERLALSDAQAGALVVVTLWACRRMVKTGHQHDAALTGLVLGLATLFKFTAAPFALMVLVVWAWQRQRLTNLLVIGAVGAACFVVPLAYLAWKGGGFEVAFGWVGGNGVPLLERFGANFALLWSQLWGWGAMPFILAGLTMLVWFGGREAGVLVAAGAAPMLVIMALGSEVMPRHYIVALPLVLVLAGTGWGMGVKTLVGRPEITALPERESTGCVFSLLLICLFMIPAVDFFCEMQETDENRNWTIFLPPPHPVQAQYINEHSAGFGLREAVLSFPATIGSPDTPVVASMFPDSCRRANFYAAPGYEMTCAAAPGREAIEAALAEHRQVYVLVDTAPAIGIDIETVAVQATRIKGYPRPAEATEAEAAVVLWRLDSPEDEK